MKNVCFVLFFCFVFAAFGQSEYYLESFPSKQELLKLNSVNTFTREPRSYVDEENFRCEGKLKFFKKGRDIDIRPIGEWKHYYPSEKVREAVLYDDKGNIQELFFFNEKGAFLSDSRYEYKKHQGVTYRIERFSAYNSNGTIIRKEYWYSRITYKGVFMEISLPKKIGVWQEFDDTGTAVLDTKEYKTKLAENLGILGR